MLKLNLSNNSNKFLETLPQKQFTQVENKIYQLIKDPLLPGCLLLKGHYKYKYYRAKVGEYRIIYRFDEKNLFIDAIGKRNDSDVYRKI